MMDDEWNTYNRMLKEGDLVVVLIGVAAGKRKGCA